MFVAGVVGGTALVIVVARWITGSWAVGVTAGVIAGVLSTATYPILSASYYRRTSIPETSSRPARTGIRTSTPSAEISPDSTHSGAALSGSNSLSMTPPADRSERAKRPQMLWTGILISMGAGVGMILGLLIAGGVGIALGLCFGQRSAWSSAWSSAPPSTPCRHVGESVSRST